MEKLHGRRIFSHADTLTLMNGVQNHRLISTFLQIQKIIMSPGAAANFMPSQEAKEGRKEQTEPFDLWDLIVNSASFGPV